MLASRTGRGVSIDVVLERLDTFLFSITYEQFFEEVNLIRRTERSNEHSRTSGLSGLVVYEWPDTTEAILVRAVAPARYGPDVVGGQRLILRSRSSGPPLRHCNRCRSIHMAGKVCAPSGKDDRPSTARCEPPFESPVCWGGIGFTTRFHVLECDTYI